MGEKLRLQTEVIMAPVRKKDFYKTLQEDCCRLLAKEPFIAHMLLSLKLEVDNDIPTASTDGFNIWINENFYLKLTQGERIFVLAHETWHVILLHFTRLGARNRKVFNAAADLEIHFALKRDGFQEPFVLDHLESWEELSAEEIYEELLCRIPLTAWEKPDPAENADGSPQSGDTPWPARPDRRRRLPSCAPSAYRGFDRHDWGSDPAGDREHVDKLRTILSREISRTGGTHLPWSISKRIDSFINPRVDWKVLLKQYVSQSFGGDRRWLPPARRYLAQKLYLPSRRSAKLDNIVVALDTSGSMTWNLPLIFGELVSLLKSFDSYDLDVLQFDTAVRATEHFSDTRPFDVRALEAHGGGGTEIGSVFVHIKKSHARPRLLMILTDGYNNTEIKFAPPPYPVLWLLPEIGNEEVAPWGRKIFVGEEGILSPPRRGGYFRGRRG